MVDEGLEKGLSFRRRAGRGRNRAKRRAVDSASENDDPPSATGRAESEYPVEKREERLLPSSRRQRFAENSTSEDSGPGAVGSGAADKPLVVERDEDEGLSGISRRPTQSRMEVRVGENDAAVEGDASFSATAGRDYSAAGLEQLATRTRLAAEGKGHDRMESWMRAVVGVHDDESDDVEMEEVGRRSKAAADFSKGDDALAGRNPLGLATEGGRVEDHCGVELSASYQQPGAAFLPLKAGRNSSYAMEEAVRTERVLGTLDGVELAGDAASSDCSDWELEQLRRAGIGSRTGFEGNAAASRVRTIVDEEAQSRGGRGEVGASVAETCFENVAARVGAVEERVSRLVADLEAVDEASKRGARELSAVEKEERHAKARSDYYEGFFQYISDITEMLSETSDENVEMLNSQMENLRLLARNRTSLVDEFGRSKRSSLQVEGDGYETPPSESRNVLQEPNEPFNGDLEMANVGDRSNITGEPGLRGAGVHGAGVVNVLSDVTDEFKSIPSILARFTEWRTQFPSDYAEAFGDLSLGKLCGAVALASGVSCSVDWMDSLPEEASGPAIIKSRAAQWAVLDLAGTWEPLSDSSSEHNSRRIRAISSGLVSHPAELKLACESFQHAFFDTLDWRVNSIKHAQVANRTTPGVLWVCRAAAKCACGAVLVASALHLVGVGMRKVEKCILNDLFACLICTELEALLRSESETDARRACSTFLFIVEECFSSMRRGGANLLAGNTGWDRVHQTLQQMKSEEKLHSEHHRVDSCLRRIAEGIY